MSGYFYYAAIYRRARKAHECIACGTAIVVGEEYTEQVGWDEDGKMRRHRYHEECFDALCDDSNPFEFTPGSLPPPERTTE